MTRAFLIAIAEVYPVIFVFRQIFFLNLLSFERDVALFRKIASMNILIALEFLLSKRSRLHSLTENWNFIPFTMNCHTLHLRIIVSS